MMKFWIYENHICELRSEELNEGWSSQLYTQLLQLRRESQACTGFETLTSAIPVQRSTNYANKPTGSRSLNWFVINPWKDDDEVMNIWKSYMRTAGWRIIWKKIIAVIDATFVVGKRKPEKIQACTRFEPLTSAIPLQRSTNWANMPTGSSSKKESENNSYTCKSLIKQTPDFLINPTLCIWVIDICLHIKH